MEIAVLIVLLFLAVLLNVVLKQKKIIKKSQDEKKFEIIQGYRKQMLELLEKYKDNKEVQNEEKIKLLKQINSELSMNIFFNEKEIKEVLTILLKLG